jgi:hypothetical protein
MMTRGAVALGFTGEILSTDDRCLGLLPNASGGQESRGGQVHVLCGQEAAQVPVAARSDA